MMDALDKQLVNRLQEGLPLTRRPYEALGEALGLKEEEVLARIRRLKAEGYIRRIGGIFDSGRLGYVSMLCALKMPEAEAMQMAEAITRLPGVTHNYIRRHRYSLWFTVTAPSEQALASILDSLRAQAGPGRLVTFPSKQRFKIRAVFRLEEETHA